jgi:hypothetical protein
LHLIGSPTTAGPYTGTLTATKARCHAGSITVTITVNDAIVIDNQIDQKYKITSYTTIYVNNNTRMHFNEDLIDLKALSDDHFGLTYFLISGDVDFGFLIDPEMDCHIAGNNSNVSIDPNNLIKGTNIVGVVIGRTTYSGTFAYNKKLTIDNTVTFKLGGLTVYGIYFNGTDINSSIDIECTFLINAKGEGYQDHSDYTAWGCYFYSTVYGNININGHFEVASYFAYGVRFDSSISGNIRINGTFTIDTYVAADVGA